MQYGAANQDHATKALIASVWDNSSSFLASLSDSSKSYSLKVAQVYTGGTESAFADWHTIAETPTLLNNPCPSTSILKGSIVDAYYSSSNSIEMSGVVLSASKNVVSDATSSVIMNPGVSIEAGAVFLAKIGGCTP